MSIELTWLGHASWLIQCEPYRILVDPFLNDSPSAPCKSADIEADFILVTHGHFDHVADVAEIANRCQSNVIAIFEIAEWFAKNQGVQNTTGMNIGGSLTLPFGSVRMTPAIHSSQLPDGSYGGTAAGFVIRMEKKVLYFSGDTSLFSDMQLIANEKIDMAILPIGDRFTMGPADTVLAINYLNPKMVLPSHYNTWPPIEQDPLAWSELVKAGSTALPIVLQPGQTHTME